VLFTRLRLTGFKSFVEPTELVIAPGLTGVVGPNGCGKSNLVEALRWVMGENSAKRMRGGEMDDVIFGGTSDRPARNLAEVMLGIDNTTRKAPAQFNDHTELEVSRRIERGEGSAYKVNGRDVRARDVQLLFADAATGAHSPSLVSQGRVGALIAAKPADRRAILEDAAGIAGLYSRRHEAELRLRAAEANLTRLEDVIVTLEAQAQTLKKQARQAARYRDISDMIRKAEAVVLALRWRATLAAREVAAEELRTAETGVATTAGVAAEAATAQANAAAHLPPLRQAEAAAAAELQRLAMARNELDGEERRLEAQRKALAERMEQIARDVERERGLAADAAEAIARLDAESAELEAGRSAEAATRDKLKAALDQATAAADTAEVEYSGLSQRMAADEARKVALDRRIAELGARRARLTNELVGAGEQRARVQADLASPEQLSLGETTAETARQALEAARLQVEQAGEARSAAVAHDAEARERRQALEAELAGLRAEAAALTEVLAAGAAQAGVPIIDAMSVETGYETALGAALGDDLTAPLGGDDSLAVRWDTLPDLPVPPPLPAGAAPLAQFIGTAPAALTRRLRQIGVVDDAATGRALQATLLPGQRLVTRAGDLWRWDGFTRLAGAPSAAAARLTQRARLGELGQIIATVAASRDQAALAAEAAKQRAADTQAAEQAARAAERAAAEEHDKAREARDRLAAVNTALVNRLNAVEDTIRRLERDRGEADQGIAEANGQRDALAPTEQLAAEINRLKTALAERRGVVIAARSEHDRVVREAEARIARLASIADETESWRGRARGTEQRLTDLNQRRIAGEAEGAELAKKPAEISEKRAALLEIMAKAETNRTACADRLAAAEAALAEADKVLRAADGAAATARESRVRAEGHAETAEHDVQAVIERMQERLECTPEATIELAGLREDREPPPAEQAQNRLDRLLRERDTMGPVNLRAEIEAQEVAQQFDSLTAERDDLLHAIAKLRGGIGALNREGRERLLASFEVVNNHFQELFVRLFGGGHAHLELTESDDPLEAGLEIMASPPGKKLQVLSLLSGGEQALTALSLIFAVFLTNPSPICVLDEVDAPLDDANVDRFCTLLGDIAQTTGTRFLVVTHHRMTMARMDRLFGVTMAERGVSQLVSVDLARAEKLRETAA
jgi:chromosome segregation protein